MNFVKISQTITLNERKRIDYPSFNPLALARCPFYPPAVWRGGGHESSAHRFAPHLSQKEGYQLDILAFKFQMPKLPPSPARRKRTGYGATGKYQMNIKWQNAKNQTINHESTK
jgi:hypothetical protein